MKTTYEQRRKKYEQHNVFECSCKSCLAFEKEKPPEKTKKITFTLSPDQGAMQLIASAPEGYKTKKEKRNSLIKTGLVPNGKTSWTIDTTRVENYL